MRRHAPLTPWKSNRLWGRPFRHHIEAHERSKDQRAVAAERRLRRLVNLNAEADRMRRPTRARLLLGRIVATLSLWTRAWRRSS